MTSPKARPLINPVTPLVDPNRFVTLTHTMTLEASGLDAGDVADVGTELAAVGLFPGQSVRLWNVVVVDQADQKADLDFYLIEDATPLGTLDAAPDISDVNALKVHGPFSVVTANYKDIGGVSLARVSLGGYQMQLGADTTSVWVAAVAPGTPTFGAATAIKLKFGIERL